MRVWGSNPSIYYFRQDFCEAVLKQKVSAFLSRNRRKNRSCQTSGSSRSHFSLKLQGKQGFWPHKRDKCRICLVDKFGIYHGRGKKASNIIWVFFDTFKRNFTSISLFFRTFPNRSDHSIFLGSISWGSSKGSKRTPKAVRRVSWFAFAYIHFSACFPLPCQEQKKG